MPSVDCLPVKRNVFYLDYVNGPERRTVFTYDPTTGVYTPTADADGRCFIRYLAGVFIIRIPTQFDPICLLIDDLGDTHVGRITELPLVTAPRIEFMRKRESVARRIGSVDTNKNFYASSFFEDVPPSGDDQFRFYNFASLSLRGYYADQIGEVL